MNGEFNISTKIINCIGESNFYIKGVKPIQAPLYPNRFLIKN